MEKEIIQIPIHQFAPYCFLEGQTGLNDNEEYLYKSLVYYRERPWVIDDLYDNPRRLAALQFLRPKTIVFGTTGVHADDLKTLIDFFFDLDIQELEHVIMTFDTEYMVGGAMEKIKKQLPNIRFWKLYDVPSMFDDEGERYRIYEIKP